MKSKFIFRLCQQFLAFQLFEIDSTFQLQSSFVRFQGNNGCSNSEIAAAEMMKSQLLAAKQDLDKNLASNYRLRAHLQMELQSISSVD